MRPIDSKDRPPVVLLGLLVAICLACDSFMGPVMAMIPVRPMPAVPLLFAIVGGVLAQGCLLAAWLAWSDQPFRQRLAWHWIVAAILYLVWAAGMAVSHFSQSAPVALVSAFVALLVPLVSIAAQIPLWIARQTFGWRLIRGDPKDDAGPAPLSIRDLMTATVLVAVALALARVAPTPDDKPLGLIWVILFVVPSAVSTIALLPASALLLRTQSFQRGLLFAGLYAGFWLGLLWLVVLVARQTGFFRLPPPPIVIGVCCLIASFAATVMLAAAAARARGYRLVWGRPSAPSQRLLVRDLT